MNLKLKRIAPLSAGKMLAALYGALSLVLIPFMLAFMALSSVIARQQGNASAPAMPLLLGMGVGMIVFLPVMYAAFGFIAGALGALVYNLLARWVGGFEFEFESTAPPAPVVTASP